MGNPTKGTAAYEAKLVKNNLRKQARRWSQFLKTDRARKLMALARERYQGQLRQAKATADERTRRANAYMRLNRDLKIQLDDERRRNAAHTAMEKDLLARVTELEKETKRMRKELNKWTMFWGWVQTHAKVGTLRYLKKLWTKGPRAAPDKCWGGGQ